jgi:hypothetical protein
VRPAETNDGTREDGNAVFRLPPCSWNVLRSRFQ